MFSYNIPVIPRAALKRLIETGLRAFIDMLLDPIGHRVDLLLNRALTSIIDHGGGAADCQLLA